MNFEIPEAVKTWSQFGHPVMMWVLFAMAIYALYLGIKVKKKPVKLVKKKEKN